MSLDAIDALTNPALSSLRADSTNIKDKTSKAAQDAAKLADNFEEFLTLLTTQLQNQDPSEPLDTNQFTQQLATLSSVEQSVQTNRNLETLIGMTQNQQVSSAVAFVGKTVETQGTEGFLENGQAEFSYTIPSGSASVTLAVLDTAGKPLFTTTGPSFPGNHIFAWDGSNSFTGGKMPDGIYRFGVVAKDANGNTLDTKTYTTGKVTGVALDEDEVTLTLGGYLDVPMSKVISVREPLEKANSDDAGNSQDNETGGS